MQKEERDVMRSERKIYLGKGGRLVGASVRHGFCGCDRTRREDAATRYQSIADVMGPVLRGCDVADATSTPKRGLAGERNRLTRIGHTTSVLLIVRRSSP